VTVQILGILMMASGVWLLGWFALSQQTFTRRGRRRVRFERALDLTGPVMSTVPNGSPFVMQPEDRLGKRIMALVGLVFLVAFLAAGMAAGLYLLGRFVVTAIQGFAGSV
jgi:hypothetical protein